MIPVVVMTHPVRRAIQLAMGSAVAATAALTMGACVRDPVVPDGSGALGSGDGGADTTADSPELRALREGMASLACEPPSKRWRNPQHGARRVDLAALAKELGAVEARFEPAKRASPVSMLGVPPPPIANEELVVKYVDREMRAGTTAEVKALLGAIDGVAKAAVYVAFAERRYDVGCGEGRVEPDGVVLKVIARSSDGNWCGDTVGSQFTNREEAVYLKVAADASFVVKGRETVKISRRIVVPRGSSREPVRVSPIETITYQEESPCPVPGRAPDGLVPVGDLCRDTLSDYLASAAYLEAGAIFAFEQLADDLRALGAPAELIARSERAALDEARHADAMAELARRLGKASCRPEVFRNPERPLLEIALENATEGCVRETYAAMLAQYQAIHAEDAGVREAFVRIAEDETAHAELSWDVATWLEARLDEHGRRLVREACCEAWDGVFSKASHSLPDSVMASTGMPQPAVALSMARALRDSLASVQAS